VERARLIIAGREHSWPDKLSPRTRSRPTGVVKTPGRGYVGRMALNVDYRQFLNEWYTADSSNLELEVGDPAQDVWLREIAEPWWAAIGELARADGFVVETFEGRPADAGRMDRLHTPCARLVMPDGTPYHHALQHSQLQEAAYRDYGASLVSSARERHRRRFYGHESGRVREPYASPLFAWPERSAARRRAPWRRSRA
jgi:hypothetical protein